VVSLVEKVAESVEAEDAERLAAKLTKGEMDLNDLAEQLRQLRKMGGVSGLMGLLPGVAKVKNQMAQANIGESALKRQEAIIQSMTPHERRRPQVIQASRKRRIAAGSGTSVPEVNKLLKQFMTMNKMMKKVGKLGKKGMMRGGFPPMPGMPGMPPRF
jgi:signal recognition particle subunit SRP54